MKFIAGQYKVLADIAGNIATAWFAGGVISPLFIKSETILKLIISVLGGILMAIFFTIIALTFAKESNND